MSDPTQPTNGEPSPHTEKLLEAANSASQTVATLHVAFMAFAAYLGVIVWGTTHEDLLRISPVKLPILDVELPLTTFYGFVPWLMILLHFNLLIQLELLSRKLWNLDKDLPDTLAGQQVRDRLFIFPFTHLIAGRSSVRLIQHLLSLAVSITVIALPLTMLLAAQIRFLPYHDEVITWWQRGAVWADVVMLFFLWPLIVSPNDDIWERWRKLWFWLLSYLTYLHNWTIRGWNRLRRLLPHYRSGLNRPETTARPMPQTVAISIGSIIFLSTLLLAFLFSIIAVIPGNITIQADYHPTKKPNTAMSILEDLAIRNSYSYPYRMSEIDDEAGTYNCISLEFYTGPEHQIMLGGIFERFHLGWFSRNLNIKEARLVPKEMSISLLTRAVDVNKSTRDLAFKEFDGIKLQGRDLRFADLSESALPKADLRSVNLQRAVLTCAKLQGVSLSDAELHEADLRGAYLEGANLSHAHLQGADLRHVHLQGANLRDADLQGTDLRYAHLQGADLRHAHLQGAYLKDAYLQGANLISADLQGADLWNAHLQGTDLSNADLQGADLPGANLKGANLKGAYLQGANLISADLQGADLSDAHLQGADLSGAHLQGADLRNAQLQGIDWSEATLDGIFMIESSESDWSKQEQQQLEATLEPLLDAERFAQFQQSMKRASNKQPPSGKPSSFKNCYSDNPALLECTYNNPAQLDVYRSTLHSILIELACSDAAIAEGIAGPVRHEFVRDNDPNFNLAAALLKALDTTPKPCAGLAALTEQTRQRLQMTAEWQKSSQAEMMQ